MSGRTAQGISDFSTPDYLLGGSHRHVHGLTGCLICIGIQRGKGIDAVVAGTNRQVPRRTVRAADWKYIRKDRLLISKCFTNNRNISQEFRVVYGTHMLATKMFEWNLAE